MNIKYEQQIKKGIAKTLSSTEFDFPKKTGKVRDIYDLDDELCLVTTDRLSAFDRSIASVPFKGQVLNKISAWWFKQTEAIVGNHFIEMVNPHAMRVKKCRVFPVEVVVRGYLTGTTNTSIWTLYKQGERQFFNQTLPEGLKKNTKLTQPILTPTTKEEHHDQPLSAQMVASGRWIHPDQWDVLAKKALEIFTFAQRVAEEAGLILVDTKFEFGQLENGEIVLVDECLTPDSSRYWDGSTYHQRMADGLEPQNFDKEILRLWYKDNCNPYEDAVLPDAPEELVIKVASAYITLYERLLKKPFDFEDSSQLVWDDLKTEVE